MLPATSDGRTGKDMLADRALKTERDGVAVPEGVAAWARRAVTLPLYGLLCFFALALLPLWLPLTLVVDLLRGRRLVVSRAMAFFTAYLVLEVIGVGASAMAWIFGATWMGKDPQRFLAWNVALQDWWARSLMAAVQRIFGLRIVLEQDVEALQGPLLVFIRHVSVGDTLLPSLLVSDRFGIRLRYVLKRELLWDPCLDIVGNRLPNYFARRGSGDSEREIAAVQALMSGLGRHDGVLIYPEGTRFTPRKRAAVLERLRAGGEPRWVQRAERLRYVLPPRLGGPLGLLEVNTAADVLFVAHVGFEGTMDFAELLSGALVGRQVRVGLWRVPFAEIPSTREERSEWLFQQWQRMDDWVAARQVVATQDE